MVTGILWCNVGAAKDLTGTILSCEGYYSPDRSPKKPKKWDHKNFKFLSAKDVYVVEIKSNQFAIIEGVYSYAVYETAIHIYYKSDIASRAYHINREDLRSGLAKCHIVKDENFDIKKDIEKRLQEKKEAQENKNKI